MRWSWKIGTLAGIEIKIHATFVLALVWGAYLWGGSSVSGLLYGVLLTIALFAVVVLHELGHSVAARRYGIPVHDIILLPIGGVARLSRMPEEPAQELVIALAGPAVNVAFVAILAPLVVFGLAPQVLARGLSALPDFAAPGLANAATFLLVINATLLAFNLIPAFPMDGGRVFRALLAMKLPYLRATRIASYVGRGLAVLLGIYGVMSFNFTLSLVALFVFFAAGAEGQEVSYREKLRAVHVNDVLDSGAPVLLADAPVHLAFERFGHSPYPALAVVDQTGNFIGTVTYKGMQSKWTQGIRGSVEAFVDQPDVLLECGESLDLARQQMVEAQASVAPVYCGKEFAGLLDFSAIGRALASGNSRERFGREGA